jgi:methylphosphotriester-DNA--protein-cysteine methyltransferase
MPTPGIGLPLKTPISWEDDYGPFVASTVQSVFHRPGCKWSANIISKNSIDFDTRSAATEAGYKPCKTCRP